ncbi:hypothetical protein ACVL5V_005546 [Bradyrhizobium ottawaense]
MARGGKRTGAGRKPGSVTKLSREVASQALASGETPAEYMLRVMRDPSVGDDRRDKMAIAAAPYVHPKLANVEHAGQDGGPIKIVITGDDAGLL